MIKVILFAGLISLVLGCRPGFPVHPQNRFCNSERAIIGEVVNEKVPQQNIYRVKVLAILKGYAPTMVGKFVYVYTTSSSSLCRLVLDDKTSYVLGGSSKGKDMLVTTLDLFMETSTLTWQQFMFLSSASGPNSYRDNCKCKTTTENTASSCGIAQGSIKESCYSQQGICSTDQNGQCNWYNDSC